jgi:hypothetical protein
MRRELKAEMAKEHFDKAMALFQQECPVIKKTKKVHTNAGTVAYSYAPLEDIVSQVKRYIAKHGFSYATHTETGPETVKATCIVKHKSGHSESSSMEVPLGTRTSVMSATQVVAAALTYAKRYAFCNTFGILTGDEDTDARPENTERPQVQRLPPSGQRYQPPPKQQPTPQFTAPVIKGKWAAGQTKEGTLAVRSITEKVSSKTSVKYIEMETNLGRVVAFKDHMNSFKVNEQYSVTVEAREFKGKLGLVVLAYHGKLGERAKNPQGDINIDDIDFPAPGTVGETV